MASSAQRFLYVHAAVCSDAAWLKRTEGGQHLICIRDLKRDRLHHWRLNLIDMRTPFTPDDTSSELELRQIHALNYMAARLGEIELHFGKIVAHLELIATAGDGVAQAIRDVGAPIRTMKK